MATMALPHLGLAPGQWAPAPCTALRPFVCEAAWGAAPAAPDPADNDGSGLRPELDPTAWPLASTNYNSSSYHLYDGNWMRWADAAAFCVVRFGGGGRLASVASVEEAGAIIGLLYGGNGVVYGSSNGSSTAVGPSSIFTYWVGLSDAGVEGSFAWDDGDVGRPLPWAASGAVPPGQTNTSDCVAVTFGSNPSNPVAGVSGAAALQVRPCEDTLPYLCSVLDEPGSSNGGGNGSGGGGGMTGEAGGAQGGRHPVAVRRQGSRAAGMAEYLFHRTRLFSHGTAERVGVWRRWGGCKAGYAGAGTPGALCVSSMSAANAYPVPAPPMFIT